MRQFTTCFLLQSVTLFSSLVYLIWAEEVDEQSKQELQEVQGRVLSSAATLGVCALIFAFLNLICCSVSLHKAIKDRERIKKQNTIRRRVNALLSDPKSTLYIEDSSSNPDNPLQSPVEPTVHVKRLHAKPSERNVPEAQPLTRLPATQNSPIMARLAKMDHTADITFADPLSA